MSQYISYSSRNSTGGGGGGTVTAVTASSPLSSTGGTTPNISLDLFTANTVAGFDAGGVLFEIPNYSINATGAIWLSMQVQPNNLTGSFQAVDEVLFIDPLQNSPNETWNFFNKLIEIDPDSTGFTIGTASASTSLESNSIQHLGTSDIGGFQFTQNYFNLGNATDPIDVAGVSYYNGFGNINALVNISGPLQGYGFGFTVDASATINSGTYIRGHYDSLNIGCTSPASHQSFSATPIITNVPTTGNYTAVYVAPNITTLTGGGGFYGLSVYPILTTMGATSNFRGMDFSPSITTNHGTVNGMAIFGGYGTGNADFRGVQIAPNSGSFNSARGIDISLGNVTDANPQGVVGIESDSRLSINATTDLVSAQGFQVGSRIEHLYTVDSGSPVTGTDCLAVNIAGDLTAQDNIANGAIGIGFNSVGFIASVGVAVGKTVDTITAFLPAVSLPDPGFTTGGSATDMHLIRVLAPIQSGGSLSITNLYGLKIDNSLSDWTASATNTWGLYVEDTGLGNYIAGNLAIDTTSKKVSNASVGFEIGGTTKALRLPVLTTTEKNALTALEGMVVFDTTTNAMEFYDGSSWTSGGGSGTVTSVAMTVPSFLSVSGSPITTSGTLAVTLSGTALPIANGGTGQTTAANAINALLPSQTGNSGKFLTTNGTVASWGSAATTTLNNLGTTSINASLLFDTNGAYDIGSSTNKLNALYSFDTRVNTARIVDSSFVVKGILTGTTQTLPSGASSKVSLVSQLSDGTGHIGIFSVDGVVADALATSSVYLESGNKTAGTGNSGDIKFRVGTSSGGTRGKIFLIDGSEGTSGHVWTSTSTGGQGHWAAPATSGTVTSVAMTVPSFLSVSGSPVTSSGTLAVTLSGTALPIANGGTGQTTAANAINALLPTQTGNSGKFLTTDGSVSSWATVSGSGATTALDNLASVAINTALLPGADNTIDLGSGSFRFAKLYALEIDDTADLPIIDLQNRILKDNAGDTSIDFSSTTEIGIYKDVLPQAGLKLGTDAAPWSTGTISILTTGTVKTKDETSGNTSVLVLTTGDAAAGDTGDLSLRTGSASGIKGKIVFTTPQADSAYDLISVSNGFTVSIAETTSVEILDFVGTLATGTVNLPENPRSGQMVTVASGGTVAALTVNPSTGTSIIGAPVNITNTTPFKMFYDGSLMNWYRIV